MAALARPGPGATGGSRVQIVITGTDDDVDHAAAAIVELAPGKDVRLRARSRVRLVPASYRASARIDVEAPPDSDEKAVSGTISVELPPLGVVRPGAKRGKD